VLQNFLKNLEIINSH